MDAKKSSEVDGAWMPSALALNRSGMQGALQAQLVQRIGTEIKGPLGAVIGFAHLMSEDRSDPLGERHRRWVTLIEQAAHYMLSLVNASIDAGGSDPAADEDCQAVDLSPVLGEIGAWLTAQAAPRGIRVTVEATSARAWVRPRALRQVLLNLGSNAIKYNREGGHVRIAVDDVAGGRLELSVQDTGLGMTDEQRMQLFQPYNRLGREHGMAEGTGLGLCIVRQLVEDMGGTIGVDSAPGEGSAFRVLLRQA